MPDLGALDALRAILVELPSGRRYYRLESELRLLVELLDAAQRFDAMTSEEIARIARERLARLLGELG